MLDHLSIPVSDIDRSKSFYQKTLNPLGYKLIKDMGKVVSFGIEDGPLSSREPGGEFWIYQGKATPCLAVHFAFSAASRHLVDEFYHAAIAAGGTDNGKPGLREHYHPHYYAAFVSDPDGYNIEAVFHCVK